MSIRIKRDEFTENVVEAVKNFRELSFLTLVPDNVIGKAVHEIVSGYMRALTECNESKVAGELKTIVINAIRDSLKIECDLVKKPETTENWEGFAQSAYFFCYECRVSKDKLLEGASKLMREIPLFSPLGAQKRIHYSPDPELVERFYSKMKLVKNWKSNIPANRNGQILSLDGLVYIKDLAPFSVEDYVNFVEDEYKEGSSFPGVAN